MRSIIYFTFKLSLFFSLYQNADYWLIAITSVGQPSLHLILVESKGIASGGKTTREKNIMKKIC